ncbi:hypothetical protein IGK74_002285 [Enterococcus sp. AZ150]|uniref:hypothetical protein n=1 Tax=Enterococcus sp. AZ150 TaxID=2774866 RepID=UPI003F264106
MKEIEGHDQELEKELAILKRNFAEPEITLISKSKDEILYEGLYFNIDIDNLNIESIKNKIKVVKQQEGYHVYFKDKMYIYPTAPNIENLKDIINKNKNN